MYDRSYLNSIKRIAGQIKGIEKMLNSNRRCQDIIIQLMAVRNSLASLASKLLAVESCNLEYKDDPEKLEKLIKDLVKLN